MITETEANENIGSGVVYSNGYDSPEDGVIVSANSYGVLVRYRGDFGAKRTNFEDLIFLSDGMK